MAISDDHGEEHSFRSGVVLGHFVGHVPQGAVGVGAFTQVFDLAEVPDEVLLGCELAENNLPL